MRLVDLLQYDFFNLPQGAKNTPLSDFLEQHFHKYFSYLPQLDEKHIQDILSDTFPIAQRIAKGIIQTLKLYDAGHVQLALKEFEQFMNHCSSYLMEDTFGGRNAVDYHKKPYFRARISQHDHYTRKELFHLPFSLRHLANTQRFSIPGFPCLYLSNSIYVCWEELGRPPLDSLQISRYQQIEKSVKIMDIALTKYRLKQQLDSFQSSAKDPTTVYYQMTRSFLATWPLIFSCALTVSHLSAPYKQEYILPQFLLQWVNSHSTFDGIKYFSIKSNPYQRDIFSRDVNYVFPPKEFNTDCCSRLSSIFHLTAPFSVDNLQLVFDTDLSPHTAPFPFIQENFLIESAHGYNANYLDTPMGKMEKFSMHLPLEGINIGY